MARRAPVRNVAPGLNDNDRVVADEILVWFKENPGPHASGEFTQPVAPALWRKQRRGRGIELMTMRAYEVARRMVETGELRRVGGRFSMAS